MDSALPAAGQIKTKRQQIISLLLSREGKLVMFYVAAAFFLRLFFVRFQYVINTDGVYYAIMGRKLITGDLVGGMSSYWPPLYPFLVGVSSLCFSDLEFAGRFVSIVSGALLVVPTYLLIRQIYGSNAAWIGALLVIINPDLIQCSTALMTESTYTLVFTLGLLLGWSALRSNKNQIFLFTGLLFGAAYLIKPEAVAFIGLLIALAIAAKLFQKQLTLNKLLVNCLLLVIGFLIFSFPYFLYLHQKTGRWTISQKLTNNTTLVSAGKGLLSLTDDGRTTKFDQLYGETYQSSNQSPALPAPAPVQTIANERLSPPAAIRANQGSFAARSFDNLKLELKEIIPQIFPYLFIFLAIIGLFRQPWTKQQTAKEGYLFLFLSATLIGYALTFVESRYLLPLLPILFCWASNGIVEFEKWLSESAGNLGIELQSRSWIIRTAILAVLVLSIIPSIVRPMKVSKWEDLPFEQKQAGLWLKEHSVLPAPLIMACGPWAAYYSNGEHIYIPNEPYPVTIDYAKRRKVDYLIISEQCSNTMPTLRNTSLAPLLDEQNVSPDLKLVYKDDAVAEHKLLIYEFTDER